MTETSGVIEIDVQDLHFDRENPRLAEYGILSNSSDEEIMEILWDAMDVREIVQSIAASGFFPHEPIIITKNNGDGYVVIEGNRRLAAVKALLDDKLAKKKNWELPKLQNAARQQLQKLPAVVSSRKESWRFLGFKHVNGPAKWSSYAKAMYIAEVHRSFKVTLSDIANQIGDRHRTVQRLFRGLMVIEQAERMRVYDREDRFRQKFAFSHLYTGLDHDGISKFISLKPISEETIEPVPEDKKNELGELCIWLYGSKKDSIPPVIKSQNPDLRQLNAVLNSREAVAALRAGSALEKSFEISRPSVVVFEEALLAAKRELTTARGHLTTGYDNSEALLRIAGTIAEMADDIYSTMERKMNPSESKKRLTEE